jgi:hypothetical protein
MNLAKDATKDQLADLLRAADDNEGHHVLWVDQTGGVHLDLDVDFSQRDPNVRFSYECYIAGNKYTGPEAASDSAWVADLLKDLLSDWKAGRKGFIDSHEPEPQSSQRKP